MAACNGGGALLVWFLLMFDACACLVSIPLCLPKQRQRDPHRNGLPDTTNQIGSGEYGTLSAKRRRRSSLKLNSYMDSRYYGEVKFGTPPQTLWILFDTGSADLWVLPTRYSLKNSTTFQTVGDTINIAYADLTAVTGNRSTDTISFGNYTIGNQTFLLITHLNYVHNYAYDGVMGLALEAATPGLEPPLLNLLQNGLLVDGTFSLYLNRSDVAEMAGEITFGGSNPDYYSGEFFYTNVTRPCCWQIAVDGISVAGTSARLCAGGCQALVDSGTAFITGPSEDIGRLHYALGAWRRPDLFFEVNCTTAPTLPSILVTIGGKAFPLRPDQYISSVAANTCLTVFAPLDAQNVWILGNAFLKTRYTKFDLRNRRVGFASLKEAGTPAARPVSSASGRSASTWAVSANACLGIFAYLFIKCI